MLPVLLTRIKTSDGVTLEGIVVAPKKQSHTALIWIHGLGSRFYSGQTLTKEVSARCVRAGMGYFKFNTRGHDLVAHAQKKKFTGAAFEKFEDCVFDIRAMIRLARALGYKNILLAGHSTGANKALYYMYKTHDRAVKGLMLLGPISDIASDRELFGAQEVKRRVSHARRIAARKPLQLLPQKYGIWSARRYVSILTPGKPEDTFPYYNPQASWKELRSVRAPIAIIIGSRDEHLDRPTKNLLEVFRANAASAKSFSGVIIKGAPHGFQKREKELAYILIEWIKKGNSPPRANGLRPS